MPLFGKKTLSPAEKERLLMQAHALQGQGEEYRVQKKDLPHAREYYQKALAILRQAGEPLPLGRVLQGLGMIHRDMKDFTEAEKCLQEALQLFTAIYDTYRQGTTTDRLATLFYMKGDNRRSADLYHKAGDLLLEADKPGEALLSLTAAASLEVDLGNAARAEQILRHCLEVAQSKHVRNEEPHVLFLLGKSLVAQGRGEEALPLFSRVMFLEEEMKEDTYTPAAYAEMQKLGADVRDDTTSGNAQVAAALELYERGQPAPALAKLEDLLAGYEANRQTADAAAAAEALGSVRSKLGQLQDALALFEKALALSKQCGRKDAIGRLTMAISMLQQKKDSFDL